MALQRILVVFVSLWLLPRAQGSNVAGCEEPTTPIPGDSPPPDDYPDLESLVRATSLNPARNTPLLNRNASHWYPYAPYPWRPPHFKCIDQVNPWTRVPDCPRLRHLCNHPQYYAFMSAQCPKTCNRCNDGVQPTKAPNPAPNPNPSNCVDQINPWTGVSDCPRLRHLCNHPQYYAFMSAQCPKTCNRCNDAVQPTHAPNPAPNPNPSNCIDQINPWTGISDCPKFRCLCNSPLYYAWMRAICPKTCNMCTDTTEQPTDPPEPEEPKEPDDPPQPEEPEEPDDPPEPEEPEEETTTARETFFPRVGFGEPNGDSSNCADLINPWTGVSDCPRYVCHCNNPRYYSWMTERCPKTCNRCNETRVATQPPPPSPPPVVTRSPYASNCVDQVNPWTGLSDCPRLRHLCNHPLYYAWMSSQCPRTCNRCSDATTTSVATTASSTDSTTRSDSSNCHDQVNPWTGRSDCPKYKCLCNHPRYYGWMTALCRKTCNRCDDSNEESTQSPGYTRSPAANRDCVDWVNPWTGVSDCMRYICHCNNPRYYQWMTERCPWTCNRCSGTTSTVKPSTASTKKTPTTKKKTTTTRKRTTTTSTKKPTTTTTTSTKKPITTTTKKRTTTFSKKPTTTTTKKTTRTSTKKPTTTTTRKTTTTSSKKPTTTSTKKTTTTSTKKTTTSTKMTTTTSRKKQTTAKTTKAKKTKATVPPATSTPPMDDDEDSSTFETTSSQEADFTTRTSPGSSRPGVEKNKPSPPGPLLPDADHTTAISPIQPSSEFAGAAALSHATTFVGVGAVQRHAWMTLQCNDTHRCRCGATTHIDAVAVQRQTQMPLQCNDADTWVELQCSDMRG